jgi:2-dehydro-3-deoxygluconokinase
MTAGLVTFGETMALLISTEVGPLRHATGLELRIGGSESNVAIGVRRLGHPAAWAGRVGDDEFGALVLGRLRGEQVDVSAATTDASRPTGLMVKATRTPGSTQVIYYRAGSAASRLAPEHLDEDLLRSAAILHVTGITAALSPSAREAAFSAVEVAAGAGVPVSFDPNHRSKLWSADVAAPVYRDLASRSTVVLAGADEAAMMVGGSDDPGALLRALVELCPGGAVLKQGSAGATALVDDELLTVPGRPVTVVDPVGAGDAFAAGYLVGLLEQQSLAERMHLAATAGAFAVTGRGDWEALPHRSELSLLDGGHDVRR